MKIFKRAPTREQRKPSTPFSGKSGLIMEQVESACRVLRNKGNPKNLKWANELLKIKEKISSINHRILLTQHALATHHGQDTVISGSFRASLGVNIANLRENKKELVTHALKIIQKAGL